MFARTLKIIFTYFIISFSFTNYVISEDLTKQEPIKTGCFEDLFCKVKVN